MRDVCAEFKELRLHGMAGAWDDLIAQGTLASLESSRTVSRTIALWTSMPWATCSARPQIFTSDWPEA